MKGFNNLFRVLLIVITMSSILGYASATVEGGWTLYGVVYNGQTCQPIQGAHISSTTYSSAPNVTNANGNYTIKLGVGSQKIVVNATGYASVEYTTPYQSTGALVHNFGLGPATAVNCSFAKVATPGENTTSPGQTVATSVATTSIATSVTAPSSPSSSSSDLIIAGIIIVIIIIIIVVVAYYSSSKKKHQQHHHNG